MVDRRLLLDVVDEEWMRDRLPDDDVPLPRGLAAPADDFDTDALESSAGAAAAAARARGTAGARAPGAGGAGGAGGRSARHAGGEHERWGELMLNTDS